MSTAQIIALVIGVAPFVVILWLGSIWLIVRMLTAILNEYRENKAEAKFFKEWRERYDDN